MSVHVKNFYSLDERDQIPSSILVVPVLGFKGKTIGYTPVQSNVATKIAIRAKRANDRKAKTRVGSRDLMPFDGWGDYE